MHDVLIRGAWIIDGSGNPGYRGSLALKDGKTVQILRSSETPEAVRIIDATGLACAPGFIDLHTHTEYSILSHKDATSSLHAGVTTEVMGMCGYGVFPVNSAIAAEAKARMAGLSQIEPESAPEVDWMDLDGWLTKVERNGTGINVLQFAGHGAIRAFVMGKEGHGGDAIIPSPEQLESMKRVVRECMEQGAFGLSSGLQYAPGRNAVTSELVELGRVVAEFGGSYVSHMRSEDEYLVWASKELIEICRQSGMRGSMTHHKGVGEENWSKIRTTTAFIDQSRAKGIQVMCDFYPWEYSMESNVGTIFYPDFELSPRRKVELVSWLTDSAKWRDLKARILQAWDADARALAARSAALSEHGVLSSARTRRLDATYVVFSKTHPELQGLTCRQVAQKMGNGDDYLEAARRLYLDDDGLCYAAGGTMWLEDIRFLVKYPFCAISTDSSTMACPPNLTRPGASAHPRGYGSFARVLGQFARDERIITMEDAVRKMTSLPASLLGLERRGMVREGFWADLCLFDPLTVANKATYADPFQYPAGIKYVVVNGTVALEEGTENRTLSGHVLRHRS